MFVDFEKAYDGVPREKLWGVFAGARCWRPCLTGRQVTVFLLRGNCFRVGRELNHGRSPWVLDSDKDASCHCFSLHNLHQRWSNYSPWAASGPPTSFIRPAKYLANFFLNATFPTVDSSATALTAACHVNRSVSGPPVARQSRIRPSGQNVWPSLKTFLKRLAIFNILRTFFHENGLNCQLFDSVYSNYSTTMCWNTTWFCNIYDEAELVFGFLSFHYRFSNCRSCKWKKTNKTILNYSTDIPKGTFCPWALDNFQRSELPQMM